jgi:hypothetical protein
MRCVGTSLARQSERTRQAVEKLDAKLRFQAAYMLGDPRPG